MNGNKSSNKLTYKICSSRKVKNSQNTFLTRTYQEMTRQIFKQLLLKVKDDFIEWFSEWLLVNTLVKIANQYTSPSDWLLVQDATVTYWLFSSGPSHCGCMRGTSSPQVTQNTYRNHHVQAKQNPKYRITTHQSFKRHCPPLGIRMCLPVSSEKKGFKPKGSWTICRATGYPRGRSQMCFEQDAFCGPKLYFSKYFIPLFWKQSINPLQTNRTFSQSVCLHTHVLCHSILFFSLISVLILFCDNAFFSCSFPEHDQKPI